MTFEYIALAFFGGMIPALFWLWFWLRQDHAHPEPRSLIATAFISGMCVVLLVLPLQKFALTRFSGDDLIFVWVVVEEVLKYAAALAIVLWHKAVDEPVDVVIYMIAIALGFSAVENALFIFTPLFAGNALESIITGHFRFIGATLLHVLASGTVGICMAYSFYKTRWVRVVYATFGLFIAIILHALFNFSIINSNGEAMLTILFAVWIGIIALLLVFQYIKHLKNPLIQKRNHRL